MEYLLDTADLNKIKELQEIYSIDGITTNPTIIAREEVNFFPLLSNLKEVLGDKMLHVQVVGTTYEEIISEATLIKEKIGGNLYIKIPVTKDGYKAIKKLSQDGFNVTATAVCSTQQAIMAAKCGASYIAVYVNRVSDLGVDGPNICKEIREILDLNNLDAKILAASFKNVSQVNKTILNGSHSVTVGPELFEKMFYQSLTENSVEKFTKDFQDFYNTNKITEEL